LGTMEFGQQTERRRKRITRLVAAGLVAAILVIAAYRLKSPPAQKPAKAPGNLPSNVNQQLSGYSFTRSDHGRQIFTVHAARTVAFDQGGDTVLKDVWVEVFGRLGDRHDLIQTQACRYNRNTGELFAEGKVQIELNPLPSAFPDGNSTQLHDLSLPNQDQAGRKGGRRPPVLLETSHLTFVQQGSMAVTDAPVSFSTGRTSGTAQGLAYATRDDWLELKRDVVIHMQPKPGSSSAPLRLEASRLRFEKASGITTLWGPVEITQQDRRVTGASGKVHLDAQGRVTAADLEGDVKASGPSGRSFFDGGARFVHAEFDPSSAQLRFIRAEGGVQTESRNRLKIFHLSADRFQINFSGRPSRAQNGNAEGGVHLTSETLPGATMASAGLQARSSAGLHAARQDLTAAALNFSFRPGGQTLRGASTLGPGKMILVPYDPKVGQRVITADPFVMDFDAKGRPATLRGLSQARIVFMPSPAAAAGTPAATTSSDRLAATFDPSSSTLRTVDQAGDFRFEQGNQQAFADLGHYDAQTEVVALTGHPRVQDEETHARADRILIDTATSTAEGLGHVQATHVEKLAKESAGQASDPTHIVADRMLARRESQYVHYQGHVRLWEGQDVVESAAMDVFKAERRVRSGSRVLTSFMPTAEEVASAGGKPHVGEDRDAPITIRADDLEYLEEGRKARYLGNVQLDTQNTTLRSDRMDVFFSAASQPGASQVERAVADGHVTVVQPARRATGEHAEYFAGPGKILVTGGPPTLYDTEKGFTTGRQLTFFLRDDRIFLDGGEESPTLSKHRLPQ
jgi:lipopolysaccharide export system protein LptA